jgi:hypothetical protein
MLKKWSSRGCIAVTIHTIWHVAIVPVANVLDGLGTWSHMVKLTPQIGGIVYLVKLGP